MSSVSALAISTLAPEPTPPHSVGITTFLRDTLMRGVPFKVWSKVKKCPGGLKGKGDSARAGLSLGRRTDFAFQRVVAGKERLSSHPKHRRLHQIFAALKKMGIRAVRTQFPVSIEQFGLKTSLDGIGLTADGHPVVLELKCTQFSLAQHDDRYYRPCVGNGMMANGVENTEHNSHMLQCAFGILGLKKHFPGMPVYGKVIYSADDGVRTYNCEPRKWASPKLFALGAHRLEKKIVTRTPLDVHAKFGKFPDDEASQKAFLAFAAKNGCTGRQETLEGYGSYVGGKGLSSKPFVVIGILHSPTCDPTTKRFKSATMRVVADAKRLQRLKCASKCKVRAALLIHGGGQYKWKTCRVPRTK
jgi:hypothetical protein